MLDFLSWYFWASPSILGWSLAIIFGAIWLACYRPPMTIKLWLWGIRVNNPWLWVVLVGGAVMAPIAIVIVSFPMSYGISKLLGYYLSRDAVQTWNWLLSIPSIFIFGLVWEGAKLVPVAIYWWRKNRDLDPKSGLLVGAVAGAGFGIMVTQWANNLFISNTNWNWQFVQVQGFPAFSGFWESFFILGLNVASTALAGWGLAKGWGWKFYLIACGVYFVTNYNTVLLSRELISATQVEFLIAAWALIVVGVTLWLRDRQSETFKKKHSPRRKK